MFSIWAKQQTIPSISASDSSKFQFYICFRSFRPDFLSVFHGEDTVPPTRAPHWLQVSVSGSRQTSSLFYPVRQLHHVCRVDAEEDVKVFPSASSWPWPSGDRSALSVSRTSLPSQSPSLWQAPSLCRPTACSSSMAVSDLLSRRRISGSVCAVQLFHQFRAAQSRVHLQEHQGNFPFRSEERPASQLRPHAFPYQTEVLWHLAERKQFRILPNSLFSKVE